jgi:hypothetical protein
MKRFFVVIVAGSLLVGCGGSGGGADRCQEFFDLEARIKPSGFNFDENGDGYLDATERTNQSVNQDQKNYYDSIKGSHTDC